MAGGGGTGPRVLTSPPASQRRQSEPGGHAQPPEPRPMRAAIEEKGAGATGRHGNGRHVGGVCRPSGRTPAAHSERTETQCGPAPQRKGRAVPQAAGPHRPRSQQRTAHTASPRASFRRGRSPSPRSRRQDGAVAQRGRAFSPRLRAAVRHRSRTEPQIRRGPAASRPHRVDDARE